jgi:magnesium-transporting ATPase (P-type)
LLLRGAFLRNTEWIIGMVVYTGLDTKIMRNAEASKIKQSDVEKKMNGYILNILYTQLVLALFTSLLCLAWAFRNFSNEKNNHWYLEETSSPGVQAILRFFTYFLLYNTMIPISLIVSMELVKVAQCYFITKDEEMYVESKDRWPKVSTTTINE